MNNDKSKMVNADVVSTWSRTVSIAWVGREIGLLRIHSKYESYTSPNSVDEFDAAILDKSNSDTLGDV